MKLRSFGVAPKPDAIILFRSDREEIQMHFSNMKGW